MINSEINYNISPGSIVQPVYDWNAEITEGQLNILDNNGNLVGGHYTSVGDKIIVLNVFTSENLALIQYPTPEGYRQGYVENSLLNEVVQYRFRNWWQNGSTSQQILQNNGMNLTSLPAYAAATILFQTNDGYICIAYGYGDGMPNQSGFSSYIGLFGGIEPFSTREYPANGETTANSISIIDYNGDSLYGRFTSAGDQITILNTLKNGELVFIEYPVDDWGVVGYRKGFIPAGVGYSTANSLVNDLTVGDKVKIKNNVEWFALGGAIGGRVNDIFKIQQKFTLNNEVAYEILDCRTGESFNILGCDIESTKEVPNGISKENQSQWFIRQV